MKDPSATGGTRGGQAEGERGCCGAIGIGSSARTLSLEPAQIGLRGVADEDGEVTNELSDRVDDGTKSVATQEFAHRLGLRVDEQPACQGAAQGLSGSPVPG